MSSPRRHLSAVLRRDAPALAIAATVATACDYAVVSAYLAAHDAPALGGGLFLAMGLAVLRTAGIPARIPHYTAGGIPYGYPPLGSTVNAVPVALGVSPLTVATVAPVLYQTLAGLLAVVVGFYWRPDWTTDRRVLAGSVLGVLVTATPAVFFWQLSAGGTVRGLAYLFVLLAVAGSVWRYRYATDGSRPATALIALGFAGAALTHPLYGLAAGFSVVALWAGLDHSRSGLLAGAAAAVAGFLVLLPWLATVADIHGWHIFLVASSTHGGLTTSLPAIEQEVLHPSRVTNAAWAVVALVCVAYLALDRRVTPLVWLLALVVVAPRPRFYVLPLGIAIATTAADALALLPRWLPSTPDRDRLLRAAVVAVIVLALVASVVPVGTAWASGQGGSGYPAFVTSRDAQAATYLRQHTSQNATVVVQGDAAEWVPLLANRTGLISPWGTEWQSAHARQHELAQRRTLADCSHAACVDGVVADQSAPVDYVYVEKHAFTYGLSRYRQSPALLRSLRHSGHYHLVYENRGVAVFAVEHAHAGSANRTAAHSSPPPTPAGRPSNARHSQLT